MNSAAPALLGFALVGGWNQKSPDSKPGTLIWDVTIPAGGLPVGHNVPPVFATL